MSLPSCLRAPPSRSAPKGEPMWPTPERGQAMSYTKGSQGGGAGWVVVLPGSDVVDDAGDVVVVGEEVVVLAG